MLQYEVSDGVGLVTFNRPDVLNAFNDELGFAALDAVNGAADDDNVRCIVITGAGRAFSSGEDLGTLADGYRAGEVPDLGETLVKRYNPLIRAIRSAPKPVVAAVNGVAAGAGASVAFACDFRIASEKAKFVLAFIDVGLVPDSGAVWFLTKMVGTAKAWELAATGAPLSADEALRLGVVNQVSKPEDFEAAWREFAGKLAAGPTRAYALTKTLANLAIDRSLVEQLDAEVSAQTEAGKTVDHLEGVQAFLEKRPPNFIGE
ncbi:MAG TPA: enoyl-CoA hydratase-related protein [Actinomycetota bacterium]|jgi:2-(1,2-epoxy-1,2-dihydrophenyl)acetyl-CoA isomerase|nr:enoyl-CoA hydratase-related protein [Actinomycetota bacterium]